MMQAAPLDAHARECLSYCPGDLLAVIIFAAYCLEKDDAWIGWILLNIDHIMQRLEFLNLFLCGLDAIHESHLHACMLFSGM